MRVEQPLMSAVVGRAMRQGPANAMAHELNNPLTVVVGSLQFLQAEIPDSPKAQVHIERVRRAIRRITEMIGHMQHLTRLERLAGLDTGGLPTLDLRRSRGLEPDSASPNKEEEPRPPGSGEEVPMGNRKRVGADGNDPAR